MVVSKLLFNNYFDLLKYKFPIPRNEILNCYTILERDVKKKKKVLDQSFRSSSSWYQIGYDLSLDTRKPDRVCDQLRLKPTCAADETNYGLEISAIASRDIILSRQRTTNTLIRLRGCSGWSAPLLFAYDLNRFSHHVAQLFCHLGSSWVLPLIIFSVGLFL